MNNSAISKTNLHKYTSNEPPKTENCLSINDQTDKIQMTQKNTNNLSNKFHNDLFNSFKTPSESQKLSAYTFLEVNYKQNNDSISQQKTTFPYQRNKNQQESRQSNDLIIQNSKNQHKLNFEHLDIKSGSLLKTQEKKNKYRRGSQVHLGSSLENQKEPELTSKVNGLDTQDKKLYSKNQNKQVERQNDRSYCFGDGLEAIEAHENQETLSSFENEIEISGKNQQTTFPHLISNGSKSQADFKKRLNDTDFRSSSRIFLKRPMTPTRSNDFLKNFHRQSSIKQKKQPSVQIKTFIKPFNQKESRDSLAIFNKTIKRDKTFRQSLNQYLPIYRDSFLNILNQNQTKNLSFANDLKRILFKYYGGHAKTMFNYQLKIKNQSKHKLGVKIKCTTPRYYEVRPCYSKVMEPCQILSFQIELKLFPHDLDPVKMKHDLTRYKDDKFKIVFWAIDCPSQNEYFEEQKVLPVVIEETEEQKVRNQGLINSLKNERQKMATEKNQIEMYKKLTERNEQMVEEMGRRIKKLHEKESSHRYFTKQLFVLLFLLGMGVGMLFG